MAKASLLFDLIRYVNAKQAFTAQEVASEFNVTVRTAHRYLLELSSLGVPIYTEQGRHGGYRILKNKLLPPITFDENEAFAIFFAFQSLKYYQSLPFDINIHSASRKLYASLPEDTANQVNRLESVLSFWAQRRSIPSPFLKEIIEAAIENHVAVIKYLSKSNDTVREVKPIGVYARDGFWYMPAFELESRMILVFRVDRILAFEDTKKVFTVPTDLEQWLAHREVQTPVRFRATLTREGVRQGRGEPWLEPDIVQTEDGNGSVEMDIDRSEIPFVADYFFRLGTDGRVSEPEEVIERIQQQSNSLIRHYRQQPDEETS